MRYENNRIIYEVGDWIVHSAFEDEPAKISEISNDEFRYVRKSKPKEKSSSCGINSPNIRPATAEEVMRANKKAEYKVGDWVEIIKSGYGTGPGETGKIAQLEEIDIKTNYLGYDKRDFAVTVSGKKRTIGYGGFKAATKPLYKFQVGDWVYVLEDRACNCSCMKGDIKQIKAIANETELELDVKVAPFIQDKFVRPVTKEEIKSNREFQIGDWVWYDDGAHKITRVKPRNSFSKGQEIWCGNSLNGWIDGGKIRLATKEEIESFYLGKQKVELCGNKPYIKVGKSEISEEQIMEIVKYKQW